MALMASPYAQTEGANAPRPVAPRALGDPAATLRAIASQLLARAKKVAALPPPAVEIAQLSGKTKASFKLLTSEGDVRAEVQGCTPEAQGFEVGSASQLQCWADAIGKVVAVSAALLAQTGPLIEAVGRSVPAPNAGAGTDQYQKLQALRAAELKYIAQAQKLAQALSSRITEPNTGWTVLLGGVQGDVLRARKLEADIGAAAAQMGADAVSAVQAKAAQINLDDLSRAYLPLLDAALFEQKFVRSLVANLQAVLGESAEELAARTAELGDTLKRYGDYIDSQRRTGFFDEIGDFFRGASIGVAKLILGGALVIGAAVGIGALARWAWHRSGSGGHREAA